MILCIKKNVYKDSEIISNRYDSAYSIEINDEFCTYNYERNYNNKEKNLFSKTGKLYLNDSKLSHLKDLINKIKNNDKFKINVPIGNDFEDCLSYIYISIDNENYKINVNDIFYELIIHLSEFEYFESRTEDEINNKI